MTHHDAITTRNHWQLLAAGLLLIAMHPLSALAAENTGWRNTTHGIEHFTGLHCPNHIARLTRIDANSTAESTMASCTYQGNQLHAVVEIVEPNAINSLLLNLRQRFLLSGFGQVTGDGAAARGLTFVISQDNAKQVRETLWPIRIGDKDHILWLNYHYPEGQSEMELIHQLFVQMLRAKEPAN